MKDCDCWANIIGMLIVFVALVYLTDRVLGVVPVSGEPLTLVGVFGQVLAPLAWLTGIPWHEATTAGELLATKVFINELVALLDLAALEPGELSERSRLIMTYSLCGFANFGSLGIMIGGLTAMCPRTHCRHLATRAKINLVRPSRHLHDCLLRCADTIKIAG